MLLETRADINFCNPVTAVAAATADMQAFASLFGWHVEARVTDLSMLFATSRSLGPRDSSADGLRHLHSAACVDPAHGRLFRAPLLAYIRQTLWTRALYCSVPQGSEFKAACPS